VIILRRKTVLFILTLLNNWRFVVFPSILRTRRQPEPAGGIGWNRTADYSPDLNPIEMAFSTLKAHLCRIGARTYDALIQALGHICGLFDPEECWNFFNAAGYASD